MSQFILGDTVLLAWTVLDTSDAPLTGMTSPTDVVFVMHRQSGTSLIAASETVTFTEIGSTGHYEITFEPENVGVYVLQLHELNANTYGRWFTFPQLEILTAGSIFTPSYSNAFCAESDIERRAGQTISSTSTPDDDAAAAFAETRAAILMSICAKWGFAVTPTTVTAGSRLEDVLRDANAVGAALDWFLSQQGKLRSDEFPPLVLALSQLWEQYVGTAKGNYKDGLICLEVRGNLASLSTDHILSGDTIAPASTAPTSEPFGGPFTMSGLF